MIPREEYMLWVHPRRGSAFTLPFKSRLEAEQAAGLVLLAHGGHASLHLVQHLQDYWSKDTIKPVLDKDLVA